MRKAMVRIGAFVVVMALILRAASYFGNHTDEVIAYFDETGWFGHDKMTLVASPAWTIGEYKSCVSYVNVHDLGESEVILDCGFNREDEKKFNVRFYGPTFISGNQPPAHYGYPPGDTTSFKWECKRNNADDPAISCERAKPAPYLTNDGTP